VVSADNLIADSKRFDDTRNEVTPVNANAMHTTGTPAEKPKFSGI